MNKTILTAIAFFSVAFTTQAQQTTAMDFNRPDCNGNPHHLFSTLDSNKVVIMEFLMLNCTPCITAGNKIKAMRENLDAQFPGHIHTYAIGFDDAYVCPDIEDWVNTNNFDAVPFDSGGAMLAYYGGFGMPTIVIVGGANHDVLYTGIGFSTSDTTMMGDAIRDYFAANPLGVEQPRAAVQANIFPNPADEVFTVTMNLEHAADVSLRLVDVTGRVVQDVFTGKAGSGEFRQTLNTLSLTPGMYLLRADVDGVAGYSRLNVSR